MLPIDKIAPVYGPKRLILWLRIYYCANKMRLGFESIKALQSTIMQVVPQFWQLFVSTRLPGVRSLIHRYRPLLTLLQHDVWRIVFCLHNRS